MNSMNNWTKQELFEFLVKLVGCQKAGFIVSTDKIVDTFKANGQDINVQQAQSILEELKKYRFVEQQVGFITNMKEKKRNKPAYYTLPDFQKYNPNSDNN